jgi:hypothetical protein
VVGRFRVTFVEMPSAGEQALPVVVADTETGTVSPVRSALYTVRLALASLAAGRRPPVVLSDRSFANWSALECLSLIVLECL